MVSPFWATTRGWLLKLSVVTVLAGIGAGLGGAFLTLVLHVTEHLAFGYEEGTLLAASSRLEPWQRFLPLVIAGFVGAAGWYSLRRWGPKVRSVVEAVKGKRMPGLVTVLNTVLQMVVVGLGASVGREVAPRELAALISQWISDAARLSPRERRVIIACGAGAGLAAVYNVPLGGALFAVEVLLSELSIGTVIPALVASGVATLVASPFVQQTPWYRVPDFGTTWSIVVWSIICGPIIGLAGAGFTWLVKRAKTLRPKGWTIFIVMPVAFAIVGLLAAYTPTVLGNGRALAQTAFDGTLGLGILALLTLIKVYATTSTIGSGAAGGTLTPSIAIGAGLGAVTGGLWLMLWPDGHLGAFALIGAAAFLASTMRAPFTGLVLVLEFTRSGTGLMIPLVIAVAGAVAIEYVLGRRRVIGIP
ncbi:chloride channel protein [Humibacter antri]